MPRPDDDLGDPDHGAVPNAPVSQEADVSAALFVGRGDLAGAMLRHFEADRLQATAVWDQLASVQKKLARITTYLLKWRWYLGGAAGTIVILLGICIYAARAAVVDVTAPKIEGVKQEIGSQIATINARIDNLIRSMEERHARDPQAAPATPVDAHPRRIRP